MIALAERAEKYIQQEKKQQQRQAQTSSINTKSGLENRQSKRKRIQEAKRGYD